MANNTTTERAATIRTALKTHGWTARDVSVRSESFSMGSAIRVVIKNAAVPLPTVKAIAEAHERIDRCEITGDILSGCNRYVSVSYSAAACDVLRAAKLEAVTAAVAQVRDNYLIDVAGTAFMIGRGRNGYGLSVWSKDGGHCAETNDANDAALYVAIGGWSH
jgi:hypothetical protein